MSFHRINLEVVLILIGLLVEVCGAFLLAVEAIGLDNIKAWRQRTLIGPSYVLEAQHPVEIQRRAEKEQLRWLVWIIICLPSGVGGAVGTAISLSTRFNLPRWFIVPVGLIIGALVGAFLPDGVRFLLIGLTNVFTKIEESSKKGTIGLIGFIILASGILMQFVGTLPLLFSHSP